MIDFYNAFISYKHAPLDNKVAEHVQRNLEHFHIPHAIRKSTGRSKIERIFRDKAELPITSDLSEIISNALSKAEYLIVICSTNTKQSIWVEREIQYFLRNHSRDQILTVLADGEPEDVIPEVLKYDEKELPDISGNMTKVRVERDLLSCDYRMPFSRAKKLELPRLAATLIGCSYDELVRRQRLYNIRRAMLFAIALILAAAGFGAYMTVSKAKVDAALEQALINRSKYLANESDSLYEQQRYREAIWLALEALPSEENPDLPVTGEAVSSLAQATYSYRGQQGMSIAPIWDYSGGNVIFDFWVNEDGTALAAVDNMGIFTVWNTEDHQTRFTLEYPGVFPQDCLFAGDDTIVLAGSLSIRGFDMYTGALRWETGSDTDYSDNEGLIIGLDIMNDGMLVCVKSNGRIDIIDPVSGETVRAIEISDAMGSVNCCSYAFSSEYNKLAFCVYSYDLNGSVTGVIDLDSEQIACSEPADSSAAELAWADEDHLMLMSCDSDDYGASSSPDSDILAPSERTVYCMDLQDMRIIWSDQIVCTSRSIQSGIIDLNSNNMVGCYSGNSFNCYDVETGEKLYEWILSNPIIDASDSDGDGWPMLITEEGEMILPAPELGNTSVRILYDLVDDINRVVVDQNTYYILQEESTDIICYGTGVYNEEWEQTGGVSVSNVLARYLDNNVLVILSSNGSDICITLINPNNNSLISSITVEDGVSPYDISIIGADDNYVYISCILIDSEPVVYSIDITSGECQRSVLSETAVTYMGLLTYNDGYLCYLAGSENDPVICVQSLLNGSEEQFAVPLTGAYYFMSAPQYFPESDCIYASTSVGDYIINADTGESTRVSLPADWNGAYLIGFDQVFNAFVVTDMIYILFVDPQTGEISYSLNNNGIRIDGFDFIHTDNEYLLLVVYNRVNLARYNAYTGEYLGNSDISGNVNSSCWASFDYDPDTGLVYIQQDDISVVDTEDWVEQCHIGNALGHHGPTDRFYTLSYEDPDDIRVGYFRHYSLEELISRANEMLGGVPIPEGIAERFGL